MLHCAKIGEQESIILRLKGERDRAQIQLAETTAKLERVQREVEELRLEIERTPEQPPPPPTPPPPPSKPLFRFLPWRGGKNSENPKIRSKSMSKIDDIKSHRSKPMVLNDDILDAIRNRRYSLRHVGPMALVSRDDISCVENTILMVICLCCIVTLKKLLFNFLLKKLLFNVFNSSYSMVLFNTYEVVSN